MKTCMTEPRRHHIVTQGYLKGFCFGPIGKERFCVYDFKRWRKAQPLNEAIENDFQTLDHFIGLDPYYLEKEFGVIEGLAVDVIRKIVLTKRLPDTIKEFSPVINLMGIFAGRNLTTRKMVNELWKQSSMKKLELIHANESIYYSHMEKIRAADMSKEPIIPYEKSKAFLDSKKFEIRTDPSLVVEEMAKMTASMVDRLGNRNWMLVESIGAEFITSNKPVNAAWAIGFQPFVPGFGLINSLVIFPISPHLALIGSWSPLPTYRQIDFFVVEGINWVTANSGATTLYAKSQTHLPAFLGLFHLQEFHCLLSTRLIK